jgi:hypothetical protein
MKGGEVGHVRGSRLLGRVRFPLMEKECLAGLLRDGCGELEGLGGLMEEAVELQSVGREEQVAAGRAVAERRVRWEEYEYAGSGERRLEAGQAACSEAVDGAHVCGGDGSIRVRVWNRSTMELERTLTGRGDTVRARLFVGGRLTRDSPAGLMADASESESVCTSGTLRRGDHPHRKRRRAGGPHELGHVAGIDPTRTVSVRHETMPQAWRGLFHVAGVERLGEATGVRVLPWDSGGVGGGWGAVDMGVRADSAGQTLAVWSRPLVAWGDEVACA